MNVTVNLFNALKKKKKKSEVDERKNVPFVFKIGAFFLFPYKLQEHLKIKLIFTNTQI